MTQCNRYVDGAGAGMSFKCRVDIPPGVSDHEGPCATPEMPRSEARRQKYFDEQSSALAQFQGPPQTTAQAYTDGATPPPGKPESLDEFSETTQTRPSIARSDLLPPGTGYLMPEGMIEAILEGRMGQEDVEVAIEQGKIMKIDASASETPEPPEALTSEVDPDVIPEPTKQRPEDQPLPEKNDRPFVQDAVIEDVERRKEIGVHRYGTPLQPMNGRDTMVDAYEEALDLTVYLRGVIFERAEMAQIAHMIEGTLAQMLKGQASPREVVEKLREDAERLAAWLED